MITRIKNDSTRYMLHITARPTRSRFLTDFEFSDVVFSTNQFLKKLAIHEKKIIYRGYYMAARRCENSTLQAGM